MAYLAFQFTTAAISHSVMGVAFFVGSLICKCPWVRKSTRPVSDLIDGDWLIHHELLPKAVTRLSYQIGQGVVQTKRYDAPANETAALGCACVG